MLLTFGLGFTYFGAKQWRQLDTLFIGFNYIFPDSKQSFSYYLIVSCLFFLVYKWVYNCNPQWHSMLIFSTIGISFAASFLNLISIFNMPENTLVIIGALFFGYTFGIYGILNHDKLQVPVVTALFGAILIA